jgi:type IV pilus assembly protein PilW
MADYWGCAPSQGSIVNHLDSASRSAFQSSIGSGGVQGVNDADGTGMVGGADVIDGTDILILSGAIDACAGTGRMVDTADTSLQVTSGCPIEAGRVVLVSNCRAGEVMTITEVSGPPGSNRTISHAVGPVNVGWVQNTNNTLEQDYGADSKVLLPYQRTFFLSKNVAGTPSLFMFEEGDSAPRELMPGFDDMQILYGRDTNGDDVADKWQSAVSDLGQMANVTAIKIQLVAASDSAAGVGEQTIPDLDGDGSDTTYTDGRLRKLYIATVKVRNRGGM